MRCTACFEAACSRGMVCDECIPSEGMLAALFFGMIPQRKPVSVLPTGGSPFHLRSHAAAFTLMQVICMMGVIAIAGASGMNALLNVNRKAAEMRLLSSARAVVQRNIDTVLGVPFSATIVPSVLALTSSNGSVYNDPVGGSGGSVAVSMLRSGSNALVSGTLTRIVVTEANSESADIRRVTFRLDYAYRSRPYSFAMTTIRAQD